jgi:hypothetical protein
VNQDLQDRIAEAAMTDESFMDSFLANPKETYRDRFHEELFPGEEIVIQDRGDGTVALVLPRFGSFGKGMILSRNLVVGSDELTDAELELVSAGIMCSIGGNGSGCCSANTNVGYNN